MRRWTTLATALGTAAILTGCGGGADPGEDGQTRAQPTKRPSPVETPDETGPPPEKAKPKKTAPSDKAQGKKPRGTVVKARDSDYGTMLFDKRNQAIYLFDKESTSRSECYGDCAVAWPPVLTDGEPQARGQVRQELLGTTERRNGDIQVTYAGQPLYFYVNEGPNEVLCHNVDQYGGLWLVVQPNGKPAD